MKYRKSVLRTNVHISDFETAVTHLEKAHRALIGMNAHYELQWHYIMGMLRASIYCESIAARFEISQRLELLIGSLSAYPETEAHLCAAWLCLHPEYRYMPETRFRVTEVSA